MANGASAWPLPPEATKVKKLRQFTRHSGIELFFQREAERDLIRITINEHRRERCRGIVGVNVIGWDATGSAHCMARRDYQRVNWGFDSQTRDVVVVRKRRSLCNQSLPMSGWKHLANYRCGRKVFPEIGY